MFGRIIDLQNLKILYRSYHLVYYFIWRGRIYQWWSKATSRLSSSTFCNRDFYIIDEGTGALDTKTEQKVLNKVFEALQIKRYCLFTQFRKFKSHQ